MESVETDDFKPRSYQVALREVALKRNTIIYLPTGSGKTFIAVLVLKHLQQDSQKYSAGGKISFIVVNTVTLVDQHAKCIEKRTSLKVGRYSGDMNLDFWPKTKWYEEFDKYNVFVMTIQILLNLTNQNFIDLNKVNLIVFDECHRGVNDQPMRLLCKSFQGLLQPPRILGLTATLLNGNCKPSKIMEEVEKLEVTYHSQVATADGLSQVTGYATDPKEHVLFVVPHTTTALENFAIHNLNEIRELLYMVKDPKVSFVLPKPDLMPLTKDEGLRRLANTVTDVITNIETLGMYGGAKSVLAHIIQIERLKRHCDDANLHIVLTYVQTNLFCLKRRFDDAMSRFTEFEKILKFSSDKVLKLISIFQTFKDMSKEELCAIIFTKRRFTAKVLNYIIDALSKTCDEYSHLKSNFMVGYNANPFNDTRENLFNSKKNREVLQSFERKHINILVASNVLEEGVDIPNCTLVVKFDYPEEYRSYIQSKGRARYPTSLYYMLVEDTNREKFMLRYKEFQEVERLLDNFLIGKNQVRMQPSPEAIEKMYAEDERPPYYVAGPNSAKVDMVSAISLLSSYCNTLPCDKYTVLSPELFFNQKTMSDRSVFTSVTIVLPTASPLQDCITGPYMRNLKAAKRAAALKACELLHKAGELDDHLLPKKCIMPEEDVSFLFKHYPAVKERMAGTNKNKRLHKKKIPKCLSGPLIPGRKIWLHIIELQPQFERREEITQSTFYDIYTSDFCFGLITPKEVPTICDFPIYVSLGTLNVSLKVNVAEFTLTEDQIKDIKVFNFIVFNDILKFLRTFLMFDNGTNAETMLLVPVNKNSNTIDFDTLREHKVIKSPWVELTTDERLNLNVNQETFLRKIVSPWYKDMGDYLVTEVSLNKTAKTQFPNEYYESYEHYFQDKYNVRLVNPNLPLLYVKCLSKKVNFIKPIGIQAKKKKEKTFNDLEIHLIPELVVKQEFPATLWIQSNLMPTLISRLSFMFCLEEFRAQMARETKIGQEIVLYKKPLELDQYLLNYVPHLEEPKPINVLVPEPQDENAFPPVVNININRDYAKAMLEMEYPWKDTEEPKDIERSLDVTILDIDYYEKFISKKVVPADILLKNEVPKRRQQLALTYYKDFVEKPIKLLDPKNRIVGPELCLIYKAMTTAKAHDIVNMERLETLGDSFLKLFSSIYIYLKFPSFNEGLATNLKGRLVSNKNLYYLGARKGIGGIMKLNDLQLPDWLPPGFKIPDVIENRINSKETSLSSLYRVVIPEEEQVAGTLSKSTIDHIMEDTSDEDQSEEGLINDAATFFKSNFVGDKTIADCVEALLGAYFQECGVTGGIKFMEWVGIIPPEENLLKLLNTEPKNPILNNSTMADIKYHVSNWQEIENDILGYQFKNKGYLLQALTHPSYTPNRITQTYEKLEFIGDAVLDFLITCHIYESCGNLDPGQLTDLRSALVNNNTFASLVVRCNLHKSLLMVNAKLQSMIDRFVDYIESKKYEIDDEVLILLEEQEAEMHLAEYIDVPKILGDIFEAIAGAIYLDSGKNLNTVWRVFYRIMWREIETFSAKVPQNLIRRLYEWDPNPHPKFGPSQDAQSGKVMVPLQFILNGRKQTVYGFGSNKNMAKKAAAKLALRQLS